MKNTTKRYAIIAGDNLLIRNAFSKEEMKHWCNEYIPDQKVIIRRIKWLDLSFRTKL